MRRLRAQVLSRRKVQAGIAAAGALAIAHAASAAVVVSSVADYEPRYEASSATGTDYQANDQDASNPPNATIGAGNIDTPSDASDLRVGYQSRHKINAAFFFQLPTLGPNEQFTSAGLNFTQIKDSATGGQTPAHNVDLWAVGVYNDISTANDPDTTGQADTVGNGVSSQIYHVFNDPDTRPGLGTSVARRRLADDFLKPTDWLPNSGSIDSAARTYSSLADDATGLADYLNDLYAADPTVAGKYLVIRMNADSKPNEQLPTQRYQIASANNANNGTGVLPDWRPTLTFETAVVPEPAAAGLATLASLGLMMKRRR